MSPNLNRYPLVYRPSQPAPSRSVDRCAIVLGLTLAGCVRGSQGVAQQPAEGIDQARPSPDPEGSRCHRAIHHHHPRHHRDPSNPRKNKRWMYCGSDRRARAHHR